jgi:heme-degrading monooxygenase HmoA
MRDIRANEEFSPRISLALIRATLALIFHAFRRNPTLPARRPWRLHALLIFARQDQTKSRLERYLRLKEALMSVIRLIFISIDPADTDKAIDLWKKECAPLMIQQKGCISEKLLRSREAHEFISYSEWESEADVEMYKHSHDHDEIVKHTRGLKNAKANVKLYEAVN